MCKTGKKLTMQRVFLKKRGGNEEQPTSSAVSSPHGSSVAGGTTSVDASTTSTAVRCDDNSMDTSSAPALGTETVTIGDLSSIPMSSTSDSAQ